MKRFYVNGNSTVFADLTQIVGINVYGDTVDVYLTSGGFPRIYNGDSHDDAIKFAEKLAAEVDVAKSGKAIPAKDFSVTVKTEEIKVADNSGEIYNEIKRIIFNVDVFAVYVGGEKYNEVRAIDRCDDDILIKRCDNSVQAGAYADKLGRYCVLYAVNKYQLYVYPDEVDFVTVDDGGNDDYAVKVKIGKHKFLAVTFGDLHEAVNRKRELEKIFDK